MANLEGDLAQFTGTEHYYRSILPKVVYTDGMKYLADETAAHWFIDKIAALQLLPKIKKEHFQVWKLKVADEKGKLTVEDGNGHRVYSEDIQYTDFPLAHIDVWAVNDGEITVIMLPSEY